MNILDCLITRCPEQLKECKYFYIDENGKEICYLTSAKPLYYGCPEKLNYARGD